MEPTIEERLAMLEQHKEGHEQRHGTFESVISNKFSGVYSRMDNFTQEAKEDRQMVRAELRAGYDKFEEVNTSIARIETKLDGHCENADMVKLTKRQIIFGIIGIMLIVLGMAGSETALDWIMKAIMT